MDYGDAFPICQRSGGQHQPKGEYQRQGQRRNLFRYRHCSFPFPQSGILPSPKMEIVLRTYDKEKALLCQGALPLPEAVFRAESVNNHLIYQISMQKSCFFSENFSLQPFVCSGIPVGRFRNFYR